MARATTKTWLSLDEYAKIMGLDPYHFNGINFDHICGNQQSNCTGIWYQHPWHGPRLSREDLAIAIKNAETLIADFVGYNLLMDWDREITLPPRYHDPKYRSNITTQGSPKSVKLKKGYVWSGGQREKEIIEADVALTFFDNDGDGFNETARITITTDVAPNEIRVYYPGENGDDGWEIRPLTFYTKTSPYTIDIPVYQLVEKVHIEGLCHDDDALQATADIYLAEVDVYRVYNSDSVQARLIYDPATYCSNCQQYYRTSCVYVEDEKNGYIKYNPSLLLEPNKLEIFYRSGWMDFSQFRPHVELDPYWKTAIAYLAAGLLDREVACCGGEQVDTISRWQDELDRRDKATAFVATAPIIENVFGLPTRGAWYAYQRAKARRI